MKQAQPNKLHIAVLIPCYNEEVAIGKVVADFRQVLPEATIYVYDNNSRDATVRNAQVAGAIVRREQRQGKGHVVRRMFADIEAEVFLLVDGDDTYDAQSALQLVDRVQKENFDLVTGVRQEVHSDSYRPGHRVGNRALTGIVRWFFGNNISDLLSGYRAMSRRFVKSFPVMSSGFEIETELSVHALELELPMTDVHIPYKERPPGSFSKLHTYRDGWRVLRMIVRLIRTHRPFQFFSAIAALGMLVSVGLVVPIVREFSRTGLVPRLPTAVLATGGVLVSVFLFLQGMILQALTEVRREAKLLSYLRYHAPTGVTSDVAIAHAPNSAAPIPASHK